MRLMGEAMNNDSISEWVYSHGKHQSDQVLWIGDEKEIKIKDREYK